MLSSPESEPSIVHTASAQPPRAIHCYPPGPSPLSQRTDTSDPTPRHLYPGRAASRCTPPDALPDTPTDRTKGSKESSCRKGTAESISVRSFHSHPETDAETQTAHGSTPVAPAGPSPPHGSTAPSYPTQPSVAQDLEEQTPPARSSTPAVQDSSEPCETPPEPCYVRERSSAAPYAASAPGSG